MHEAALRVTVPECWVTRIARDGRTVRIVDRKVHGKNAMESLVEVARHSDDDGWDGFLQDIEAGKHVSGFRTVAAEKQRMLGIVRCRSCDSCRVLMNSDCFVTSAVSRDGTLEWTVQFGKKSELSRLLTALRRAEVDTEVDRIVKVRGGSALTPRQAHVLALAWDMGYFDFPKRAGIEDLAKRLHVSKSTVAEILHRAEQKVLRSYIYQKL